MNFSSLAAMAKKALGDGGGDAAQTDGAEQSVNADQLAKMAGMNPAMLEQMTGQLKQLLADGKITEDEVKVKLAEVASKIGIPKMFVPKLTQAVFEHLKK